MEVLVVVAIMGILGMVLYDLNLHLLTSGLYTEIKNDLLLQGQQALNQIQNRLISSRLILADQYNKTTNTWTGVGSYYTDSQILEVSSKYPPLPTVTPGNTDPGGSDYYNVIARIESRTVGGQVQLITTLVPPSSTQAEIGLSAASIGNSILFVEVLPARRVCHQWGFTGANPPTRNYLVDTYRLNYYYLHQNPGDLIAGKGYYVDLIQWESIEFADYTQILQIATDIKRTPPPEAQNAENPSDILDQLKNPATVTVHNNCTAFFAGERGKSPLTYAWDVGNAATNITGSASIRANFYTLNYVSSFNPNNSDTNDDVPLDPVISSFKIPLREAKNLLPNLSTGAILGRTPYSIAFNGGPGDPVVNIPHLVPVRFNPYDTRNFIGGMNGSKFMGGFEIGIVSNATAGFQVNLRLVLMADSGILRRTFSQETVTLVATRN